MLAAIPLMAILSEAQELHLYLDDTLESRIVDAALHEAGMRSGEFLLDWETLVIIHREPRSRLDYPRGPLAAFSRYQEPHPLNLDRINPCRVCLFKGRRYIIEHLRYKAAVYRLLRSARLVQEGGGFHTEPSEWEQSLTVSYRWERFGYLLRVEAPAVQSFPPLDPVVDFGREYGCVSDYTLQRRMTSAMEDRAYE